MKIKISDFYNGYQSLIKLLSLDLEFKLVYRINKITKRIIGEMKELEEARTALVEKHGEKAEKGGGGYVVPEHKIKAFTKELNDLRGEEIDIGVQKIPYDLLEESKVRLSAFDMRNIEVFIEDPAPVPAAPKPKTGPPKAVPNA